jgi:hypothetical protein
MASKAVAKVRDKATQKVMMNLAKDGVEATVEDFAMNIAASKPTYRGPIKAGATSTYNPAAGLGNYKPGGTTQQT